jgi:hypothetical protein
MIANNPSEYSVRNLGDDKFYKDLLSSYGVPSMSVGLNPFMAHGLFSTDLIAVTQEAGYFDIGNIAAGVQVAVPNRRNFYHGSLYLTAFCPTYAGPFTIEASLSLQGVAGSASDWTFLKRSVTAEDTEVDHDNQFSFLSTVFTYIYVNMEGAASSTQFRIEYNFVGMQISY